MAENIFNHNESSSTLITSTVNALGGSNESGSVDEFSERIESENMFLMSILFVIGAVGILVTTVCCVIYREKVDDWLTAIGCGPPSKKKMLLRKRRNRQQRSVSPSKRSRLSSLATVTLESSSSSPPSSQQGNPDSLSCFTSGSTRIAPFSNRSGCVAGGATALDKYNTRSVVEETPAERKERRKTFVQHKLNSRLKDEDDFSCHICLGEFEDCEKLGFSENPKCSHTYHPNCIVDWLSEHRGCPICQKPFFGRGIEQEFEDQYYMREVQRSSHQKHRQQQEEQEMISPGKDEAKLKIAVPPNSLVIAEKPLHSGGNERIELEQYEDEAKGSINATSEYDNDTKRMAEMKNVDMDASVSSSKASSNKSSSSSKASSKQSRSSRQSEKSSSSSAKEEKWRSRRGRGRKQELGSGRGRTSLETNSEKSHSPNASGRSRSIGYGDAEASMHSRMDIEEAADSSQHRSSIEVGVSVDEEDDSVSVQSSFSKQSEQEQYSSNSRQEDGDDVSVVSGTLSQMLGSLMGSSTRSDSSKSSRSKDASSNLINPYGKLLDDMEDDHSHYEEEGDIFDDFMERGEIDDHCSLDLRGRESEEEEQQQNRDDVSMVSGGSGSTISRLLNPIRMFGDNDGTASKMSTSRQKNSKRSAKKRDIPLSYSISNDENDSVGGRSDKYASARKQKHHQQRHQHQQQQQHSETTTGDSNEVVKGDSSFTTLIPLKYISSLRKEQRKYHGTVFIPSAE